MKQILIFTITAIALISCEPNPSQRIRQSGNYTNEDLTTPSSFGTDPRIPIGSGTGTSVGTGTGSGSGWLNDLPADVRGCGWSTDGQSGFAKYHSSIGSYTLCQANNELDVYIQIQNPPTENVCIIPTNTSNGYTTYIGEAKCFRAYSSQQVYKVTLSKNRSGASHMALTGVAVMKDERHYYPAPYYTTAAHPDAFFYCLQQLETRNDPRWCNTFDSVGEYVLNGF